MEIVAGEAVGITGLLAAGRIGSLASGGPIVPGRADPAAFLALFGIENRSLIGHPGLRQAKRGTDSTVPLQAPERILNEPDRIR
jgi:hypothetical protein